MEINYALIALTWGDGELDVYHFCGYKNQPTEEDYSALAHRLKSDPQYGLTEVVYQIQEASPALVKYYKALNPSDEEAYYVDDDGAVVKM